MTKGNMYKEKQEYVERTLSASLEPVPDFTGIKYVRRSATETEYVRISSLIGTVAYLDVTAFSKAKILSDVTDLVLYKDVPESVIDDACKLREIAPLFGR